MKNYEKPTKKSKLTAKDESISGATRGELLRDIRASDSRSATQRNAYLNGDPFGSASRTVGVGGGSSKLAGDTITPPTAGGGGSKRPADMVTPAGNYLRLPHERPAEAKFEAEAAGETENYLPLRRKDPAGKKFGAEAEEMMENIPRYPILSRKDPSGEKFDSEAEVKTGKIRKYRSRRHRGSADGKPEKPHRGDGNDGPGAAGCGFGLSAR